VQVAAGNIAATRINVERMCELASDPALLATDAADYLVRKGVPFRTAHEIVGKLLRDAEKRGEPWTKTPLARLREFAPEFGADFHSALSVDASLAAHSVTGGTASTSVSRAIAEWRKKLSALIANEAKHRESHKKQKAGK
jgi:argininosuccinate lyase